MQKQIFNLDQLVKVTIRDKRMFIFKPSVTLKFSDGSSFKATFKTFHEANEWGVKQAVIGIPDKPLILQNP